VCIGDNILSSSEDQRFKQVQKQYEKRGAYTCVDAKWVKQMTRDETNKEWVETNEKLECLTITEFVKRNIG
jgi:hypothetical protein